MALLTGWKERGLETEEEVRRHIARFNSQNALLRRLYDSWGLRGRVTAADRTMLTRWMEEWGFTESMVLFTGGLIRDAEKPMAVLNKKLEGYREAGITTEQQAADAEKAWQESHARPQGGQGRPARGKVVIEQQYEQREYEPSEEIPDWMKQRMEARKHDESTGNPAGD